MKRLASKLVVPVASAVLGLSAMLVACMPEASEESYPVVPSGGSPVASGTGEGTTGDDDGTGGTDNGNTGNVDAGVGVGDGGIGPGDAGPLFGDAPTALLDAAPADAGTVLIPSDAQGMSPFPEGDQIP